MDKMGDNKITSRFLLVTLILLFCLTLYISITSIIKYQKTNQFIDEGEIIEIKTKDVNASIINNGYIEKKISKEMFEDEEDIILENIDVIELNSKNQDNNSTIRYDIKYDISKNTFTANAIPSNDSEVLVKFSYSYDKENWTYINNVISTENSNISPLIGNTYDISGLVTKLNVVTNYELSAKEAKKVYWRSETIFKNKESLDEKELNANFTIQYKSN